jgi:hypothetical protein
VGGAGGHFLREDEAMNSSSSDAAAVAVTPSLVPELLVTNLEASLRFWVGLSGFRFPDSL